MADTQENAYLGAANQATGADPTNLQSFLIWQILRSISGAKLVKVVGTTNNGGVSPVGFVDVQPLVNQLDGWNNATPHGTVYHLPYFRLQGGTNAVIIDPQVGDIGVAVVEDRDISSVKATKAQANPGSKRIFDIADGLYLGGFLNGTPQQYVQFSAAGIAVVSPTKVTLQAPLVEVDASSTFAVNSPQSTFSAAVTIDGLFTFLGGMVGSAVSGAAATITGVFNFVGQVFANGKRIDDTHTHNGVQPGSGNSGTVN
ncbi:oxidoreductase [Ralstonia sp. 3PA37C10]|uniref:oxidoreductase n=1 Tax=unclassified Ralstonia TaxID=209769 RepID=UPI0010F7CC9F|nr:oxidoreductase [Ralstonia sp. 3PA37C10]